MVLDSFEHLIEGTGLMAEWLWRSPGIIILCTSREPLHCRAVYVLAMDGIPMLPLGGDSELQDVLAAHGSVQLVVDRANRARQRFILNDENIMPVVQSSGCWPDCRSFGTGWQWLLHL